MPQCIVPNCQNKNELIKKRHEVTYHMFPKEEEKRQKWTEIMQNFGVDKRWKPTEQSMICSLHFDKSSFFRTTNGVGKLKNEALPTKRLGGAADEVFQSSAEQPHCSKETFERVTDRVPSVQFPVQPGAESDEHKLHSKRKRTVMKFEPVKCYSGTKSSSSSVMKGTSSRDHQYMSNITNSVENSTGLDVADSARNTPDPDPIVKRQKLMKNCIVAGCRSNNLSNPHLGYFQLSVHKGRRCPGSGYDQALTNKDVSPVLTTELNDIKLEEYTFSASHRPNDKVIPQIQQIGFVEPNLTFKEEPNEMVFFNNLNEKSQVELLCADNEPGPDTKVEVFDHLQIKDSRNKTIRKKYTMNFKMFALRLYCKTPNAYRLLRATFRLPRISTLYRMMVPTTTEVSDRLLQCLKLKVGNMTTSQRCCMVSIGTMTLTPNIDYNAIKDKIIGLAELGGVQTSEAATAVLIVTVRGIFHKWKQMVAFSFLKQSQSPEDVKNFIDQIIRKLFEIGLEICAYMTDHQTDALTAASDREISKKQPFFKMHLRKIYYMYDPLHLLLEMCDLMMNHEIDYRNHKSISWNHIEECHRCDVKESATRLAPNLTEDHVKKRDYNHKNELIDNLKLVRDIFSLNTARAILAYVKAGKLTQEANTTAQWIATLAQLTDTLNFSTVSPAEDKSRAFAGNIDHIGFLEESYKLFSDLGRINLNTPSAKRVRQLMDAYCITIKSLHLMFKELKADDCWYPLVGLSRDCIHEFFNRVRVKHGNEPTAKEVWSCITDFPAFNLFTYVCNKRFPNEMEEFMCVSRGMPDIEMFEEISNDHVDRCQCEIAEFSLMKLPPERKLASLSLYLLIKALFLQKNCADMHLYLYRHGTFDDEECVVSPLEFTLGTGIKINMVPRKFREVVNLLEQCFLKHVNTTTHNIYAGWLELVKDVTYDLPFDNFPLDYVKSCFLRCRLSLLVQHNNELLNLNKSSHRQGFALVVETLS